MFHVLSDMVMQAKLYSLQLQVVDSKTAKEGSMCPNGVPIRVLSGYQKGSIGFRV